MHVNPSRLRIRAAGLLASCLIAAVALLHTVAPARAELALGVNRTNLAWEGGWRGIVDEMNRHGVKSVRLTLVQPWKVTAETVLYANERGMDVLLNVPLSLPAFYPPTAQRRPGNGKLREIHRLSLADVAAYEQFMRQFLDELQRRGGRLVGIEIGNEINWADFNGDLPLQMPGRVFNSVDELRSGAPDVLRGFEVYGQLVAATKKVITEHPSYASLPLLSAGFIDARSPFIMQSGGTALSLPLTARLLRASGAIRNLDGLAVHVYPRVGPGRQPAQTAIAEAVGFADHFCAEMTKPCHLTEWGFARPQGCGTDPGRSQMFEQFVTAMRNSATIRSAYLFDWDASRTYNIYRCGGLVDGASAVR
jgi:hypothetical protein